MFEERIEVECYSGHRANERPVAFTMRDQRFEIEEIVDRWYEGGLEPGRPELSDGRSWELLPSRGSGRRNE